MNTVKELTLSWWRVTPEPRDRRQLPGWHGLCISSMSPQELRAVDGWLRCQEPTSYRRRRTTMCFLNDESFGDFQTPSFVVWFKDTDTLLRFIYHLEQFEKRPRICFCKDIDQNTRRHLRKVKSKWVLKTGNGWLISMSECKEAIAVLVLLRLLGD